MGNEQSAADDDLAAAASLAEGETKVEPGGQGSRGRERGQSESRSRSASPQKKRHQKGGASSSPSPPPPQQPKEHPPETRPGGGGEEEEEDEWLQGSAALAIAGGGGSKGGKKKKGKKGKGGGQPAAAGAATKSIKDTDTAVKRKTQPSAAAAAAASPASPPAPRTPPKATAGAAAAVPRGGKSVRWGAVVVQTFQRRPSQDSVPASGAWPLGLGEEDGAAPVTASLDAYEAARWEEIEARIQDLPRRLRKVCYHVWDMVDWFGSTGRAHPHPPMTKKNKQTQIATGETRQFDFKSSGDRNPIFGPLREQERKQVLVKALLHGPLSSSSSSAGAAEGDGASCSISISSSPAAGSPLRQAAALEEQEQQRCEELDALRASRRRIGCSCHQSKDPSKLSLKRLKEELHHRHLSAPGTDKAKLVEMLKQALSAERLCSEAAPQACECFEAGVPCHADVCGCCAHKKGSGGGGGNGSGNGASQLGCHNPVGNVVYKEGQVHGYRDRFVSARRVLDGRARSCSI